MAAEQELREKLETANQLYGRYERKDPNYEHYFRLKFPLVRELFDIKMQKGGLKKRIESHPPELMISLVGFSSPPVILSVLVQKPENLYFLFTPENVKFRPYLMQRIRDYWPNAPEPEHKEVKGSDPVDTYSSIRDIWIEHCRKGIVAGDVAIDITGGKKTMAGGAFAAACIFGFKIWYVDSEFQLYPLHPRDGTEFYRSIFSPLQIFSEQDRETASQLFDKCHYEAAYGLLSRALCSFNHSDVYPYIEKSGSLRREVEKLAAWAECYMHWDNTEYSKAKAVLERTQIADVTYPHVRFISILSPLREIQEQVEKQKRYLSALEVSNQTMITMFETDIKQNKSGEFAFHFALDIYLSALRREKQGNYDDAIVRMARAVDICAQHSIYEGTGKIEKDTLGIRLGKLSQDRLYQDRRINELVHLRNNLVPIHNISTVAGKEMREIQPAVSGLLENFGSKFWRSAGEYDSFEQFVADMQFRSSHQLIEKHVDT